RHHKRWPPPGQWTPQQRRVIDVSPNAGRLPSCQQRIPEQVVACRENFFLERATRDDVSSAELDDTEITALAQGSGETPRVACDARLRMSCVLSIESDGQHAAAI